MAKMTWLAVLMAATTAIGACGQSGEAGSTGGKTLTAPANHTVDVGGGRTVRITKGDQLDVALFIATTGNVYSKRIADEARDIAKREGFKLTIYDARFDATTQFNQLTSALQRRQHNAWYVTPINGRQSCKLLSEQAPAAGILVAVSDIALCGRDQKPAEEVWQPGTLNFVGAEITVTYIESWLENVADRLHGRHRVGVLLGPPLITLSRNIESGLQKLRRSRPDLEVVATKNTDFTTPDGLAKTQTLLQSHPDIDVLISAYADITVGAAQALKQAGRAGEVKVFDLGGASSELAFIKDGTITASAAYSPRGHARAALQAILNAFQDEPFDRYASGLSNGDTRDPFLVDKSNVGSYRPEF